MSYILVSVVLPVFNGEKYINDCIRSILSQSCNNIEIVISDDSENNDTWNEIKKISDSRIKLIKNTSGVKGIFGNLNHAIQNSTGEFIQIFCQDDIMFTDFIKTQCQLYEKYPNAGLIFSQFDVITSNNKIHSLEKRYDVRKTWPEYIPKEETANYLLRYGCMPGNLSPVMIKRSVFTNAGPFNQNFPYAGDFEYWTRLSGAYPFVYNSYSNLAIRRHSQQASNMLGKKVLINDLVNIYKSLMQKNTLNISKNYLRIYINQEIGVQQIYYVLKSMFKDMSTVNLLKNINKYPLNIIYSFVLMLITINGRIKPFKI